MDSDKASVKRSARIASEAVEVNDSEDLDQPNVKRMKPEPSSPSSVPTKVPASALRTPKLFCQESMNVALQVSEGCRIGPIFDETKIRSLLPYESLPYPDLYTRVVQDLIRCALRPEEVVAALKVSAPGEPSTIITFFDREIGKFACRNIPVLEDVNSAYAWLSDLLESLGCCKKLFLPDFLVDEFVCKQCFQFNQGQRLGVAASGEEAASDNHATWIKREKDDENDEEEKSKEAEEEERERIDEEKRKIAEEEIKKRIEDKKMKERLVQTQKKEAEKKRREVEEEKRKAEIEAKMKEKERKREDREKKEMEHLNKLKEKKKKAEEENRKLEKQIKEAEKKQMEDAEEAMEAQKERYNYIHSVFLVLFKIPEERAELRPDLKNTLTSSSPDVSFKQYVRVSSYNFKGREMWKLGDQTAMGSNILKKITTHCCQGHFSPAKKTSAMLDMWQNLLLHCHKCVDSGYLSKCQERLECFMRNERIRMEARKREEEERRRREEDRTLREEEDRIAEEQNLKRIENARAEKRELYNNINAFFFYHFKLPEGRTDLRPDLGNPVVSNCPDLSLKHMVRSNCSRLNGKEIWQLGVQTPMDSSVLKAIIIHSCPNRAYFLDTEGTLLELWHRLLLHCPKCISEHSLKDALDKVREFIEAECKRN